MWNKKAQVVVYAFMLGLTILVLALALAPPIKQSVDTARNVTNGDTIGMDCSNASISNFDKVACYASDLSMFYIIGFLIFMAGAVITAKIVFTG